LLRPFQLYYPFSLFVELAPWLAVLGYTVVHCWRHRHPRADVLVACVAVTLAILSFAGKLRRHYVLPVLPLCAVLMAWALVELFDRAAVRERIAGSVTGDVTDRDGAVQWLRAQSLLARLLGAQVALIALAVIALAWLAFRPLCAMPVAWARAV